ncbi:MAG TPA: alternative ribosome rescue aminoacyl-tRNA hydrolase ArfB [Anaerolineales bacterium]|nr:alternative ribosome rescue aminoacyl-tRNA hydrolase ArfB [Anaerolineales bacterium]
MIQITPSIQIEDNELQFEYIRASGPGGQNVNKVATAVQLRFNVKSSLLRDEIKQRLTKLAGNKMTNEGVLILEAKRFRTQDQNREDAIRRFATLIQRAATKPKERKKTLPTKASRERRLKAKKQRGNIKKIRQDRSYEE